MQKKLVVIGGGASGFFCAINAAMQNPHLQITILEKQSKVLQKVKVSGGGRCNVTHACFQHSELLKKYPRGKNFLKKTFQLFSTQDTINWFQQQGVELKTESDGRMFPASNSSQSIIDCLLALVSKHHIQLQLKTEITALKKTNNTFELTTQQNDCIKADFVFVACGGFAKTEHYQWLQKIGHTIENPIPSLFTFNVPQHSITQLMGVVVENAIVKIIGEKLQEQGPVLITHWGFSGPAILRLSAWGAVVLESKKYEFLININWLGKNENEIRNNWNAIREQQKHLHIGNKNPFGLPNRLWEYLIKECAINPETKWSELAAKEQNKLIHTLTTHEFLVKGKTTFKEEFVTCGGISLAEIDANNMQSKLIPNLFFGGEVLNIDGITGGFNFQNAWTTGYIAAKAIAQHE